MLADRVDSLAARQGDVIAAGWVGGPFADLAAAAARAWLPWNSVSANSIQSGMTFDAVAAGTAESHPGRPQVMCRSSAATAGDASPGGRTTMTFQFGACRSNQYWGTGADLGSGPRSTSA